MAVIKLTKVNQQKIWGQEDWIISAHPNGMSIISEGKYSGMTLQDFFNSNKQLLGVNDTTKQFPLLVKIIDAKDDLSVQVHPNDNYALEHENSLGKTECWYVLEANNNDIIIGQKTKNKTELKEIINREKLIDYLNQETINNGDFFYIPAGCVHAIKKDTKILEVQQSSDITYRLYDYNRTDDQGHKRDLHISKSLDVINYNLMPDSLNKKIEKINNDNYQLIELTSNQFFTVNKVNIKNEYTITAHPTYMLIILIDGNLLINNQKMKQYEGFLITKDQPIQINGVGSVIIADS